MIHPQKEQSKPILDTLDQVRQRTGHGWSRVFRDWVEIIFVSLQRNDDDHAKIVERYKSDFGEEAGQAAIEAYSEGFAELLGAMESTEEDLLGYLYQEYGAPSDRDGQFFTPSHVAELLAEVEISDSSEIANSTPDDPIRIGDPACGSGTLLVAAGQQLEEIADSPYSALFYGKDKDPTCAKMSAINFAVRGLPGCVTHGNSLTGEATATWKILPAKGLMGEPIQECEPLTFVSSQGNASSAETATSRSENDAAAEEEVEVDMEMSEQAQFSAFTDGGSDSR